MNILVIGNGFDLAHGLPTKYTDFWSWIKDIIYIMERIDWEEEIPTTFDGFLKWSGKRQEQWTLKFDDSLIKLYMELDEQSKRNLLKTRKMKTWIKEHKDFFNFAQSIYDIDREIKNYLEDDRENKKISLKDFNDVILEVLKSSDHLVFYAKQGIVDTNKQLTNDIALKIFFLIYNNFWVQYFLEKFEYIETLEDNWIDFEKEIADFVIELNENKERVVSKYQHYITKSTYSQPRKVIEMLDYDLKRIIMLLEIYLCVYIQNINCKTLLNDVCNMKIEYVVSFNYTNTYERIYGCDKKIIYDYIHGKADIKNTLESNNMVLGIDEYLPDNKKDKDIDFIAFKKYYQRIYKGTGCKYKEWVDQIIESWENETEGNKAEIRKCISRGDLKNNKIHNLYIFGHSLDDTDKDVLRDLLLNDNVHTTIFYHSKEELGRKIANLVKVIGQDELIKRTGGSTRTIEFKEQQEMVDINA